MVCAWIHTTKAVRMQRRRRTDLAVLEGHDLVPSAVDDEDGRLDVGDAVDVGEHVAAEREAQGERHAVDR